MKARLPNRRRQTARPQIVFRSGKTSRLGPTWSKNDPRPRSGDPGLGPLRLFGDSLCAWAHADKFQSPAGVPVRTAPAAPPTLGTQRGEAAWAPNSAGGRNPEALRFYDRHSKNSIARKKHPFWAGT